MHFYNIFIIYPWGNFRGNCPICVESHRCFLECKVEIYYFLFQTSVSIDVNELRQEIVQEVRKHVLLHF